MKTDFSDGKSERKEDTVLTSVFILSVIIYVQHSLFNIIKLSRKRVSDASCLAYHLNVFVTLALPRCAIGVHPSVRSCKIYADSVCALYYSNTL